LRLVDPKRCPLALWERVRERASAAAQGNAMLIIDLTLPISDRDPPFVEAGGYTDPPTLIEPWVRIGDQRDAWTSPYHVSRLQISAHAGTHIDAPSHFHPGAPTVTDLPTEALVGAAVVIDVRDSGTQTPARLRAARERASQLGITPLILTPPQWLTPESVDAVIVWQRPLIAFAGEEDSDEGYVAVSRLLGANRWIAGNLDLEKALLVRDGDLLVIAPLLIDGIEGCPCRVLAIRS
jgi:arylformamidase